MRGRVRASGVREFLGVPYAGPTSGTGRFRPPAPLDPWQGVLDAIQPGPSCPQPSGGDEQALGFFGGIPEPSESEDCLVLNVWTPAADGGSRPVLVYLHGGGHAMGSGSWPVYDGAAMASRDAVVVTTNHRLSLFGYLELEDLLGVEYASSGTCGMLDVVAALEWVRENAAAFGGDAANVTVFGESGGGSKVVTLLAMPAARGLFSRAVVQSGWYGLRCSPREQARAVRSRVLDHLGLQPQDAAQLLTMPVERLVEAVAALGGIDSGLNPVVDGAHITAQPVDAVRAGALDDVPMVIGSTRHEYAMFLPYITAAFPGAPTEAALTYLRAAFGEGVDDVVAAYREAMPGAGDQEVLVAVATDAHVREPAIAFAEAAVDVGADVYAYRFDWPSPVDASLGAAHGLDVPFVFDTADTATVTGTGPERAVLAEEMCSAWVSFARDGVPSPTSGLTWPRYTREGRTTFLFDVPSRVETDPAGAQRRAWEAAR